MQAIVWAYKRKDGGTDPDELRSPPDGVKDAAERGYKLLEAIQRVPGHNEFGELKAENLAKWIVTVRQAVSKLSRADVADICIGKLLSHALIGDDGIWPCEPVRQVIEDIQSESLTRGI